MPLAAHSQDTSGGDEFSEFEELKDTPAPAVKEKSNDKANEMSFEAVPEAPSNAEVPETKKAEPIATQPEPQPVMGESSHASSSSVGSDEPDFKKEERFHNIYKKYNSAPTAAASWDKATSQANAQVYNVQRKDTLWDVSKTLFGDSYFWPKIWSLNNEIVLNPHEISPGMKINFYAGTLSAAPSVAFASNAPVPPSMAKANSASLEPSVDNNGPPPPFRKPKKLRHVPESLPIYRFGAVNKPKPKIDIENLRKPIPSPLVYVTHYLVEDDLKTNGEVKETELGGNTASEFQYIIVQVDDPSQKIYYSAVPSEIIGSPYRTGHPKAKVIELQGEIELLNTVGEGNNVYRAVVKKNIGPVTVGAKLISGRLPKANVSPGEQATGNGGFIIGGQFGSDRQLFSKHNIVFIDSGSSSGLHEGQTLTVKPNFLNRNSAKSLVKDGSRSIGTVKVLKTTANFSTCYITEATEDIWAGDSAGDVVQVAKKSDVEIDEPEKTKASEPADSSSSDSSDSDEFEDL
jgi:hypothetical protein